MILTPVAKEYARKEEQAKRWLALDENSRAQIKQGVRKVCHYG